MKSFDFVVVVAWDPW